MSFQKTKRIGRKGFGNVNPKTLVQLGWKPFDLIHSVDDQSNPPVYLFYSESRTGVPADGPVLFANKFAGESDTEIWVSEFTLACKCVDSNLDPGGSANVEPKFLVRTLQTNSTLPLSEKTINGESSVTWLNVGEVSGEFLGGWATSDIEKLYWDFNVNSSTAFGIYNRSLRAKGWIKLTNPVNI